MTDTFTFSDADIQKRYEEKDFSRSLEPNTGVWYEFAVKTATIKQTRAGYLQLNCMVAAIDQAGESMFTKFVNAPLPVAYKGNEPPAAAAGICSGLLRAFFVNASPYDAVKVNPANEKKRDYYKNGVKLDTEAFKAGEKNQTAFISSFIDKLIDPSSSAEALESLTSCKFFGQLTASEDGKFVNVRPITGILPEGTKVVYDAKVAYGRK